MPIAKKPALYTQNGIGMVFRIRKSFCQFSEKPRAKNRQARKAKAKDVSDIKYFLNFFIDSPLVKYMKKSDYEIKKGKGHLKKALLSKRVY